MLSSKTYTLDLAARRSSLHELVAPTRSRWPVTVELTAAGGPRVLAEAWLEEGETIRINPPPNSGVGSFTFQRCLLERQLRQQ